ncbi:hypothetical protein [Marinilactibacillus sp. Marseille-P9653]|uniref:hypothetical protein n=1 Tax=Marinilactibacillus sp. Marseille-P9653 TaxID=2866583 RepID=UPI001CE44F10|nr:hypothetical protein [Marinilactibacillus sp. Marseille-P9653]
MFQSKGLLIVLKILYSLVQSTWGFIQTAVGLLLFLFYYKQPHSYFHGAIRTKWTRTDGVSLGLFIFTPNESDPILLKQRNATTFAESCSRMAVHEYGHTFQSLLLGPLYLPIIGLISFTWARHPRYKKLRTTYHVPYSFCWVEQWADALGESILKQPSLRK